MPDGRGRVAMNDSKNYLWLYIDVVEEKMNDTKHNK